jgi:translation initiation factor eIF-2B subunit epsilon
MHDTPSVSSPCKVLFYALKFVHRYSFSRPSVYLEDGVKLAQSCDIRDVVIGTGTHVAANARINNCIVGRNCKIMEGAEVTCSYLWDNVVVHAGARVHDGCLLATGVEVGAASVVGKGVVLSFGVKVAPNHNVRQL